MSAPSLPAFLHSQGIWRLTQTSGWLEPCLCCRVAQRAQPTFFWCSSRPFCFSLSFSHAHVHTSFTSRQHYRSRYIGLRIKVCAHWHMEKRVAGRVLHRTDNRRLCKSGKRNRKGQRQNKDPIKKTRIHWATTREVRLRERGILSENLLKNYTGDISHTEMTSLTKKERYSQLLLYTIVFHPFLLIKQ